MIFQVIVWKSHPLPNQFNGDILYKYDILVGGTTGITWIVGWGRSLSATILSTGKLFLLYYPQECNICFYYTEQNTKHKRGKMTNPRDFG